MVRPKIPNTPAAVPTTAPRTSLLTFSETSALASSISSRTSSVARSEISWTAEAIWGELSCEPFGGGRSAAKALDEKGEGDAAHEGGADQDLGTRALVGGRERIEGRGHGGLRA